MASLEEPVVDQSSANTQQAGSESTTPMSAVIIGGTGAVGKCLVGVLLKDKLKFGKVTVVGRRKVDAVDEKYGVNLSEEEASGRLIQVEQDMDSADDEFIQRICTGVHVFFCCLGTTKSAAGSAERFHQIDYDIPLKFAKAAKAMGVSHYSLVSSAGAKTNSMFLYLRTKGEIEEAVKDLKFDYTTILRPGFLDRGQENRRFTEKMIGFFVKGMPVGTVAEAMAIDSYSRYTSDKPTASEEDVAITTVVVMDNSAIYQTVQQQNNQQANIGTSVDPPAVEEKTDQVVGDDKKTDEESVESTKEEHPIESTEEEHPVESTEEEHPVESTEEEHPVKTTKEEQPVETTEEEQPVETTEEEQHVETTKEEHPVETNEGDEDHVDPISEGEPAEIKSTDEHSEGQPSQDEPHHEDKPVSEDSIEEHDTNEEETDEQA